MGGFIYLYIYIFYIFIYLYLFIYIYLFIYLYIYIFIYLYIYIFIYLYIYIFIIIYIYIWINHECHDQSGFPTFQVSLVNHDDRGWVSYVSSSKIALQTSLCSVSVLLLEHLRQLLILLCPAGLSMANPCPHTAGKCERIPKQAETQKPNKDTTR